MSYVEFENEGDWVDDVNNDHNAQDDEAPEWERENERVALPDADISMDESMDGDHDSAMVSIGWGTDEDYGCFGGDNPYEYF